MAKSGKKKKYYGVYRGRRVGVYKTWKECEAVVKGYSGARYKGFESVEAAENFVRSGVPSIAHTDEKKRPSLPEPSPVSEDGYVLYTDGGCIGNANVLENRNQAAGWGVYIELPNKEKEELYGPVEINPKSVDYLGAETRSNNTAELSAIGHALRWLLERSDTEAATIKYDSNYAAKITQRQWTASKNLALSATCQRLLARASAVRTIRFEHVKGHSGNPGNERADALVHLGCQGRRSSPRSSSSTEEDDTTTIPLKKKEIIDLTLE